MGEFRPKINGIGAQPTRSGLIAALDVGSSKVACVIGRKDSGVMKVLGSAVHEARGMRAGAVTSLDLAEASIREAVEVAERLANTRVQDVVLSVQCGTPMSLIARAERKLGGALITDAHLREIIAEGKRNCRAEGYETIQAAPVSYVVDQSRGIRDPRGMFCDRLGVTVHAVAVPSGPLQNLRLAVERCHLTISRQIYAPFASAMATLASDEMALGATLIDMGAGVTSVAIFMEDAMIHADSIPLGGSHVTSDIARMFSTPLDAAERVKSLYGSALGDFENGTDMIEVPQMGEDGEEAAQRIKRSLLTRVIQSRIEEILTQVRDRLRDKGFDVAAGRRAVLTGGGCQLPGVRELAGHILNKHVRIGRPTTIPGLAAANAGPGYATVVGLFLLGATTAPDVLDPRGNYESTPQKRGLSRLLAGSLFG